MSLLPKPPDISVLKCGAGDMTFSFDPNDPLECARAERVVQDMLKRGYLLFAKVDDKYTRVLEFDAAKHEYVVADGPMAEPSRSDEAAQPHPVLKEPKPKGRKGRRIAAHGASVTGVAPTSGG